MNSSTEKLYEGLLQKGYYTKDYNSFLNQFTDNPDSQNRLYNNLLEVGLYTKSFEEFQNQFFPVVKKKVVEGLTEEDFGGSMPGDFGWAASKFGYRLLSYGPDFFGSLGRDALYEMEEKERKLAEHGLIEEYTRYDFGDLNADNLVAAAEKQAKDYNEQIIEKMRADEDFQLGLSEIQGTIGEKILREDLKPTHTTRVAAVGDGRDKYRQKTQADVDKEKDKLAEEYWTKYANEYYQGDLKDYVMSQLTPEQRSNEELVSMLSDKLYYHAGINSDLDGDGKYNDQPVIQDMMMAFDNSVSRLQNGIDYAWGTVLYEDDELKKATLRMNEVESAAARNMTQYQAGIVGSYGDGDIWNGTKQLLTGVAGAVPSIAVSMTGLGGAAALGVSGGFRAYADVAYDDSFKSDWGKLGYAVANGAGDFAFARVNHMIFKGAQANAMRTYTSGAGRNAAANQGKAITSEMIRGYAARKGLAFGTEFLEEAGVELLTSYAKAKAQGKDYNFQENIENIIDAGLIGGFAGVSVESIGNQSGRIRAASNSTANVGSETQRDLEKQRADLIKELSNYASRDPQTFQLQAEINRIDADIENIVRGREDFYTMMSVRHEAEFKEIQELDMEIQRLSRKSKKKTTSESQKATLEKRLADVVRRRLELQERFVSEDVQLTQSEADVLFSREVKDSMAALDMDIQGARDSVTMLRDRMGTQDAPSQAAIDTAEAALKDATQKKKDARKLIGDVEAARKAVIDARVAAQTEGGDVEAFNDAIENLREAEANLRNVLKMKESIMRAPSRFVGDVLDINAQIANRAVPQWTEDNIQALESSGLSRQRVDEILQSDNYAMLTAENPNNRAVGDESNTAYNNRAQEWLKSRGLDFHKIVGRYDNGENSFLVEGMTKEQAVEFAREFQQESVAHKDGLVLRDGSMQVFEEGVSYDDAFDNYFSAIKDAEGNVVRFSKNPSSKFVDPNGKEITKQDFDSRIRDLETNMDGVYDSIIKEASRNEVSDPAPTTNEESSDLPADAVEVKANRGVRVGDPGISSAKEARDVNNLYKTMSSVYNGNVRMVLMPDGSADYMGEGNGGLFFESKEGVPTIYINAAQVSKNAAEESSQAKGLRMKYRTKSFSETVVEEVGHALVGSSFQTLSDPEQEALYENAIRIANNANDGGALLNRLKAKGETYRADGKPENIVREEVVLDLISSLAGGESSVNLSFADSVRQFVNDLLVKVGFSKEMRLNDPNSIFKVASQLNAARKSGKTFGVDVEVTNQSTADTDEAPITESEVSERGRVESLGNAILNKTVGRIVNLAKGKKSSALVKPTALVPGADGKITVSMNESFYKWKDGIKKDIGNTRITKKFNDKFHFMNWWKKATNFGSDSHFSGFQTEDGRPIDTSSIRVAPTKQAVPTGNEAVDGLNLYKSRVLEAQRQGLLDSISARQMMNMYYNAKRTYDASDKSAEATANTARYMDSLNAKAEEMLKRASEATGKPFDFESDTPHGKASMAVKLDLTERGMYSSIEEKGKRLQEYYGINYDVSTKSLTRALHSGLAKEAWGIDYNNQTEAELTTKLTGALGGLMKGYYGTVDQRTKMFGSDPVDFFKADMAEAKTDVAEMLDELGGEIDSTEDGMVVAYQFIKAATSIGNTAAPNITLAKQIMLESAKWRSSGGETYIDPRIIQDVRNGRGGSGLVVQGIPGPSRRTIADTLVKLNDAISRHQSEEDGNYNFASFLAEMNAPVETKEGRYQRFTAQNVLSEKVGAFALNLNGNMDAVTIDSNMGRTMLQILGVYVEPESVFESYRHEFADMVGMKPYPAKKGESVDMFSKHDAEIIQKVGDLATRLSNSSKLEDRNRAVSIERKLNRIAGADPAIPVDYKRRRIMEGAMTDIAASMNLTNAEFSQLLFADGQVMKGALDMSPSMYRDYASGAKQSRAFGNLPADDVRRIMLEKSIVDATNAQEARARINRNNAKLLKDASVSKVSPREEAKASKRLNIAFNKVESAEDSPLYRRRSPEEALLIKPDMKITDQVVSDALGTDATSRRILGKGTQLSEGQQVGVRLNLNVMKKTGIPVQTMHDKTATGEALKYAAVVTVKDPVLNVNQNARRKILTFQENKFPMASVDGKFLSDKISQGNFDGVKAFFNPFKHNVFVDAQGRPIKSAGEATIVGNTVYLRGDIEYYDYNDPILREGREETEAQRKKRIKRGPKYDKALKRFRAYAENVLSMEFNSEEDLKEAYDNMTLTSQVALDESEAASRAEEANARASSRLFVRRTALGQARKYGSMRQKILSDPANYFSKQSIAKAKDRLNVMSDQELIDIMTNDALGRLQNRNDDMGVLASAELIKRAVARGDMDALPGLISEAASMGTSAGRILRHFRELKNSTPAGIVEIIRKEVELRGRVLSQDQDSYLNKVAGDLFRIQAEVEDLLQKGAEGEDVDAILTNKVREMKEIERAMDTFTNTVIERDWSSIGQMLIQGNLLTTMSQATNIGANIINSIGKIGVDLVAYPIERLINIFNKNAEPARRPSVSAYMYGVRKFGSGFVEALNEVMTGQSQDVTEWRVNRGFMPFRSLLSAIAKDNIPVMMDGKETFFDSQRVKLYVQGTLGIPAEVMFRLLSLGDTPFRRMFEGIDLYQRGTEMGLEGEALKRFVKYPSKADQAAAAREGRKVTFQEETWASEQADKLVNFFEGVFGGKGFAKYLVRTFIPYRRTPANLLYETMTFAAPPVAIARAVNNLKDGDSKEASQNLGKAVIGGTISATALMLIKEGLLSGPIDYGDDEEKNLMYDQFPPNSINISGLRRLMNGGDPSKQKDDYFISYNKLGIIGAIMGAVSKTNTREELLGKEDEPLVTQVIQNAFGLNAVSSMSYMMDQSFLQGIQGLTSVLSASSEGDLERAAEEWFVSMWSATTATVLPNQLAALYRSHREYLPDTRVTKDMDFFERLKAKAKYIVLDRTFGLGSVPVRTNWKGEPIKQTPRGADDLMYQLFDITKARQGEDDPVSNEIYRLYESTENITEAVGTPRFASTASISIPDVASRRDLYRAKRSGAYFPWMEDEDFVSGNIRLSTDQLNRMMAVVGKARYEDLEKLINSAEYSRMSDEERVEAMNELNRDYSKAWSYSRNRLSPHTIELCKIINEIYEQEKAED